MCGIHRVYVVFEHCEIDGRFMLDVYDNYTAAQACVEAGRAAGRDRWFVSCPLEDEYVPEEDHANEQENNHG
jgi:hypothetical protein